MKCTKSGSARWGILCSIVKGGGTLLTDPRGLYKIAGTQKALGQNNVCAHVRGTFSFAHQSPGKSKRISQFTWVRGDRDARDCPVFAAGSFLHIF